jgi:hypothetical protein
MIYLVGEVSPSLHPGLRPVFRYPLLGAAGYHSRQDSSIRWAHPRTPMSQEKINSITLNFISFPISAA